MESRDNCLACTPDCKQGHNNQGTGQHYTRVNYIVSNGARYFDHV